MTSHRSRNPQKASRKTRLNLKTLAIVGFAALCTSCHQHAMYDQYQVVDGSVWKKEKTFHFSFQVDDTTSLYNLTLEIRNNSLYPYRNLWLLSYEERPIGPLRRDTVECLLADENEKWLGSGISLYQSGFPIRTNYRFEHSGLYSFGFRHGMRDDALPGIEEIGLKVEKIRRD